MLTDRGSSNRPDSDGGLVERERAILDFERTWWTEAGVKEPAIRERFGLSATRYYQLLAELVDRDEALAYDPLVVRRLRRMRDRRRRARYEGRPLEERPGR
jgi:beta-phosphoglucomutase-like phosphatase (HAD superfamily)